ncbi:TetR/AcrR family transcriptional regulator [Maritimibacter sp. UBA3975]|uniref:TetR/AcrR family transcriptional regulator n=1 Tax=Maritimibacter sp. UBA3975 TaxID=1946833 RepID=UPI000C0904AB|nr:TetR/AcrR family transcriptional regulator [Maritimibacter sp. UBA3975]MAM61002.1 TetR family transcriptional regulator [Maritimibacter sp.]|tara:strand:+ start:2030 stop:2617 length:588 start_codon:yes stop_codon:yes gene_type:complete
MARKSGSHADITGPKVREAALKLFARDGYAAVSMRKIAAEVGVQAGALYLYTPDKQSLLYDLMKVHMEELLAAWAEADVNGTPPERLEAFARFHIHYHLDRPDNIFIAYMELRNLEPENFAEIEVLRRRYEQGLIDILEAGNASGDFAVPDPKLAAMAAISMLNGVTTWFRDEGRLSRETVETIYWDMLRKSVAA